MGIFRRKNQEPRHQATDARDDNRASRPSQAVTTSQGASASNGALPASILADADDTPLVERENALARLKQSWDSAIQGRGRVVLLAAEAGHGKSALARAFLAQVAASETPHKIACAACSAQSGRDEPFWPFADVMSQVGGVCVSDPG